MLAGNASDRPTSPKDLLDPALAARLDRLDVLSRKVFEGKLPGERRSKRRGQSVEFDDFRPYVPGDDLRHVDWNVLARLDRFVVKLFRAEEDLSVELIIDASASMAAGRDEASRTPTKLAFALRLAMALGAVSLSARNRLAATLFTAGGVRRTTPLRGRRSLEPLAAFLTDDTEPRGRPPAGRTSFEHACRLVASARTGRGVVVIIGDMLMREGVEHGLNAISGGRGFDGHLLRVLAPAELDPSLEKQRGLFGDLRLTDAESGHAAEVTLTPGLLKRYRQRFEQHQRWLETLCRARGVALTTLTTDTSIADVVLGSLRRRRLVG